MTNFNFIIERFLSEVCDLDDVVVDRLWMESRGSHSLNPRDGHYGVLSTSCIIMQRSIVEVGKY